jgi:hypothetical protein
MLPPNILEQIKLWTQQTTAGFMKWHFIESDDTVFANTSLHDISIKYDFDYNEESSLFIVKLIGISPQDNRTFNFHTKRYESDYDTVGYLFDCAKASQLNF